MCLSFSLFCFVVIGFVLSLFSEALWNLVASHSRTGKDQQGESGQHEADFEVILFIFINFPIVVCFFVLSGGSRLTGLSWFFSHNRSCYSSVHCFLKEMRDAVTTNVNTLSPCGLGQAEFHSSCRRTPFQCREIVRGSVSENGEARSNFSVPLPMIIARLFPSGENSTKAIPSSSPLRLAG